MTIHEALFGVIDFETTGFPDEPDDEGMHAPVEFALTLTTSKEQGDHYRTFVDPQRSIPAQAKAVHHIHEKDVAGAPTTFPYGIKAAKPDAWVAHNAKFDRQFVPRLDNCRWICTMRLARKCYPELAGYGNQFLRYALGVHVPHPYLDPLELSAMDPGEFAHAIGQFVLDTLPHRALPDTFVTAALLRHLLANLPPEASIELNEFCRWCDSPTLLSTIGFGKYKGSPWSEVPGDYLDWLIGPKCEMQHDVDTLHTINHYLGIQ